MIDRSTAWGLLSQRPGPTHVLAKMYYGDEAEYLPIGSGFVNLEDEDFLPLITTIPNRFQEVDFWTREFSVADLTLEILNLPFHGSTRFSDLLDERGAGNDVGFENRPADVRLWRPGITTWADCFDLFPVGVMRKPYVQGGMVFVEVQDPTFLALQNVQLDRLQDADAADTDQGLPEESQGKVKPRPYGNRTFLKGNDAKSLDTASEVNNMTRARPLGQDSTGRMRWLIADFEVNELLVGDDQAQIWGWDPVLKRRVRMYDSGADIVVEQNNSSGCIISVPAEPEYLDYFYGKGTVQVSHNGAFITDFANPERAIDKDFSTATRATIGAGSVGGADWALMTIPFGNWEHLERADTDITDIQWGWYGLLTFANGSDNTHIHIALAHIIDVVAIEPESGGGYPEARIETVSDTNTKAIIDNDVLFSFYCDANHTGAKISHLDVYQVYKIIRFKPADQLDLYFAGKGAEIDANWTNRAVVDGYDVQHADHGGSGNLGENPATLIELTLRNEAGLGDSRLDLNSLNSASVAVAGLKGAPAFLQQPDSYLEALFSLVQQFRGFLWWTPEGKLFLKILEDDYTTPNIIIDGNLITSFNTGRTDISRLYTAVQLLYNGIQGSNIVETTLVEDATAQLWYNITQAESLLKFDAPAFKDSASAVSVGDYFLANHLNIHSTVGCELPIMFNHLDIGTLVGFENLPENMRGHDLSASYTIAGQTVRPYFLINSVDRSDELKFKAFQIHKLD